MSQEEKLLSRELLSRASPEILEEMLGGAMEPNRLLSAALKQALYMVYAQRGVVFTSDGIVSAIGYDGRTPQRLRRHLDPLLMEGGMHWYSAPMCNLGKTPEQAEYWDSSPQSGRKVVSMAGVIPGPVGLLAVLAVEREGAFSVADQKTFVEWLDLVATPASAAVENVRAARKRQTRKLRLSDLPLEQLEQLPTLAELERLIIAEAMRRNNSVKRLAAEQLGLTREGLRKKILRLAEA